VQTHFSKAHSAANSHSSLYPLDEPLVPWVIGFNARALVDPKAGVMAHGPLALVVLWEEAACLEILDVSNSNDPERALPVTGNK